MLTSTLPRIFRELLGRDTFPGAVSRSGNHGRVGAVATLTASVCVGLAACASTQPYNPNHLSADQLSQVGEICQSVMGFAASEPVTDNLWPGDPDSSSSTNRYRGCIATLSNSLTRSESVRASKWAEQDCASQGFVPGSSDLARCVLTIQEAPRPPSDTQLASLDPKPYLASTGPRFSGLVPAAVRKEQLACADVGIDPNDSEFASCVQGLTSAGREAYFQDLYRNN